MWNSEQKTKPYTVKQGVLKVEWYVWNCYISTFPKFSVIQEALCVRMLAYQGIDGIWVRPKDMRMQLNVQVHNWLLLWEPSPPNPCQKGLRISVTWTFYPEILFKTPNHWHKNQVGTSVIPTSNDSILNSLQPYRNLLVHHYHEWSVGLPLCAPVLIRGVACYGFLELIIIS